MTWCELPVPWQAILLFNAPFSFLVSLFLQIAELDFVQEATSIIDEQLLEAVNLEAKSSIQTTQLGISKAIEIARRVASPHTIGDGIDALYVSPTIS